MILNIDLGSLYIKASVLNPKTQELITSEVIRLERNTINVVEVLITSIIESYSKKYDIRKIYIIPNLKYVDCEIIEYESVIDEKYQKIMKGEINRVKKEEKKKERMGEEYEPSKTPTNKIKYTPIRFSRELTGQEVFHQIEYRDLMKSNIYVEYVNSDYLKGLTSIIKKIDKDISIISPIRALKYLPFPKVNRIVINYGHRNIVMVVIDVDGDGEEHIREVKKESIAEFLTEDPDELYNKHDGTTLDTDPIYRTKLNDIRSLKDKYKGYKIYTIGGYSNFIQNDLFLNNEIIQGVKIPTTPKVIENVILPSLIFRYKDFPYNSLQMQVKNKLLNAINLSNQATKTLVEVSGDLAVAGLIIALASSYHVTSKYIDYNKQLKQINFEISKYEGADGRIGVLEERIQELQTGRTKNYYNISELLTTLSSPLEVESIEVDGGDITMVAYADNIALVQQFLETVRARQLTNMYTKFSLNETDVTTVFKDGRKLDRVVFEGRIY